MTILAPSGESRSKPKHRACHAQRRDGEACRAPATSADGRWCLAHDPDRADVAAAARRRGGLNKAKPRLADVLRERVEARADAILDVYFAVIDDAAVDPELRMRACERLLDRVHGRPRQAMELSGPSGDPLMIAAGRLVVEGGDDRVRDAARQLRSALVDGDAGAVRALRQ